MEWGAERGPKISTIRFACVKTARNDLHAHLRLEQRLEAWSRANKSRRMAVDADAYVLPSCHSRGSWTPCSSTPDIRNVDSVIFWSTSVKTLGLGPAGHVIDAAARPLPPAPCPWTLNVGRRCRRPRSWKAGVRSGGETGVGSERVGRDTEGGMVARLLTGIRHEHENAGLRSLSSARGPVPRAQQPCTGGCLRWRARQRGFCKSGVQDGYRWSRDRLAGREKGFCAGNCHTESPPPPFQAHAPPPPCQPPSLPPPPEGSPAHPWPLAVVLITSPLRGGHNSQTTPATTSTSSIRQLLGAADAQTAHHATSSTAPTHQLLGSANAETTPARALAAAADRKQQPGATCEAKNG